LTILYGFADEDGAVKPREANIPITATVKTRQK